MQIKRLYITDDPSPSARRQLCWEDEHGNWLIGDTNSPTAFAQGFMGSPGSVEGNTEGRHPELKPVIVYTDWFGKGEDGPSYETDSIIEPVLIEAWRRWNAQQYDQTEPGPVELPTPGTWTISPDGFEINRTGDI